MPLLLRNVSGVIPLQKYGHVNFHTTIFI